MSESDSQIEAIVAEMFRDSEIPPDSDVDAAPEIADGDTVGNYRVKERLGEGGVGFVHRARQEASEGDDVALKILKKHLAEDTDTANRFRRSVEIAASLEDRHIVRIYDIAGLDKNPPFFTMKLVPGSTLANPERQRRFRDPSQAAALMSKIARAVQFAHEKGVLHRDLKPSNVLLDFSDEPYLTDFMARRIDDPASGPPEGCIPYMAPEQATGESPRTWTDVYGLGAMFYELLTGRAPIDARTLAELRAVDRTKELERWRRVLAHVDVGFREVCLAALMEDPLRRHPSAGVFAESLQRVLAHKPPLFPPTPKYRRVGLWTRRHPLLAVVAILGLVLLVAADVAMFVVARSEKGDLQEHALRANAALATAQAQGVLAGLKRYADYALQASSEPFVRELLVRGASTDLNVPLQNLYDRAGLLGPEAVFVVDEHGKLVSLWPPTLAFTIGREYVFRDYYQCAKSLAENAAHVVCVCPAYRTESNDTIQFAFSAPVYDAGGKWLGAFVLSKSATRTLGEIDFNDRYRSAQRTAVIGGRGPDRARPANRKELIVLVHPDLHGGAEFPIDAHLAKQLIAEFSLRTTGGYVAPNDALPFVYDHYVDPLSPNPDRMLAGFAPVGQTGYVVAVTTPYEKALRPNQRYILATYGSILNLSFLIIAAIAVWTSLKE